MHVLTRSKSKAELIFPGKKVMCACSYLVICSITLPSQEKKKKKRKRFLICTLSKLLVCVNVLCLINIFGPVSCCFLSHWFSYIVGEHVRGVLVFVLNVLDIHCWACFLRVLAFGLTQTIFNFFLKKLKIFINLKYYCMHIQIEINHFQNSLIHC